MGLGWSSAEERQPLLQPPPPPPAAQQRRPQPRGPAGGPAVPVPVRRLAPAAGRVYGRRWLVLLLFSLLGFSQGLVWNSWGPIQNSARLAFGFSGWDIALLVFWGPIGFVPCFFFMWLMDKKGERGGGRWGRHAGSRLGRVRWGRGRGLSAASRRAGRGSAELQVEASSVRPWRGTDAAGHRECCFRDAAHTEVRPKQFVRPVFGDVAELGVMMEL